MRVFPPVLRPRRGARGRRVRRRTAPSRRVRPGLPRSADVALAAAGILLSLPVLAVAAVAIKLETPGPVFFRQARVGMNGDPFQVWKLRTMRHGAPPEGTWDPLTGDDPRITRTGAILRRFSLDEVPNLINVLRGEMSIVGPRPTIAEQVAEYDAWHRRRLEVKPGLTGWAQVNGRASLTWGERIRLDVWYVDNRSPLLDLTIIARTVKPLLMGGDLYETSTALYPEPGDGQSIAAKMSVPLVQERITDHHPDSRLESG